MDYETTQKMRRMLLSGESLLWAGQPRQGVLLRGSDIFMIPFSLLWGGFAMFWEYNAYTMKAPIFFLLFGGIFVVAGIYIILGRFIADTLKRKHTYYGVTSERILIYSEFPVRKLKSLELKSIADMTYTDKPDGSGSISFGPQHPMAIWASGMSWPGMSRYQGMMFELIGNVTTVYETIRDAQKSL